MKYEDNFKSESQTVLQTMDRITKGLRTSIEIKNKLYVTSH